jgi:small subunit ribosomal protein S6
MGACGSGRQLRPPVAIRSPAASRAASFPTFAHLTRRQSTPPRRRLAQPFAPAEPAASAIVTPLMAGLYDLMLLVDPTAPEERRDAVIAEVESLIQQGGGEIAGSYDWGQRRLAFEIQHRPEADYRLYQFQGDPALLERLNGRLRILDGLLRFRIIKVKPGQPTPPPPDQQAARRRDEREQSDTRVAARAAADAPPPGSEAEADADVEADVSDE